MNVSDNKKSFLLYTDCEERVSMLSNVEAGILYKAIIAYAARGEKLNTSNLPQEETGVINARLIEFAFKGYKAQLDRDREKYNTIKQRRSEAGKKHHGNQYSNLEQNGTNGTSVPNLEQNGTNGSDSVSDNDSVSDIQKEKNKEKKGFKKPSIEEVSAYVTQIGASIDASDFVDFYDSKGWMIGTSHMKDWKAAVRTWKRKRLNNMASSTTCQQTPQPTEDPQIASFKSWASQNTPYIYSQMSSHDFYEIKRIAESKAVSQILSLMEKDHFGGEILPEFKSRYNLWEAAGRR